ncbi:Lrp/AsnC family transcriptional regulator [Kordiimonas sp. SCSIO 12603]|uniref:Lrp/AsnC family transcriptional regulator n=1 Tax=Kordiimonas sp. SCSIO 12603 TaxID=2829596 RepID=UPI002102D6CE|nr:Lrp/AsnC family transcriptional regulator [Kordiimonas sp. SCSIO 12603]UTW59417.1 Lrp/AsnC family transcriptional regulator [Kordiimonas sp. SCSIO 12603]
MLNAIDFKILEELQQDCMISLSALAEKIGSSKSVCGRRIQHMVDKGYIRDRVAIVNQEKIGLGITVFAHVKMNKHDSSSLESFADYAYQYPQVLECHTMMGDYDFLLKIVVPSVADYKEFFWESLSKAKGVREINSNICLVNNMSSTALPLTYVAPEL